MFVAFSAHPCHSNHVNRLTPVCERALSQAVCTLQLTEVLCAM